MAGVGGAMALAWCRCVVCKLRQEDGDELAGAVYELEETMERVHAASEESKRAAMELVQAKCDDGGRESDVDVAWFRISTHDADGGGGAAALAEALELSMDGTNRGGALKGREENGEKPTTRRFGVSTSRGGTRKSSASSISSKTNVRICELEDLIFAAATIDVATGLFCNTAQRETHLGAWLSALRVCNTSQSLVAATRLLTLISRLRTAMTTRCDTCHDENEVNAATSQFVETLISMAARLTLEESYVACALIEALEEHARVELRRLADGAESRRTRPGIAIALVHMCQQYRRVAPVKAQTKSDTSVVSVYSFLADAAKARFEALEDNSTDGAATTNTECGADEADGGPKVASLEDIVGGMHPDERRWRSLRGTIDRLSMLIDAEMDDEHAVADDENAKIIDAVGLRPLSIAAGVWVGMIQSRLREATGNMSRSSNGNAIPHKQAATYDTIFAVYGKLIGLERTLANLIEDDRALGDSDSDNDSDEDDDNENTSGANGGHERAAADVLMLESHFSHSLESWAVETKSLLENVVTKIVDRDSCSANSTRFKNISVVDDVVSVYTSLFDIVDVMGFALRVSSTARRVVEEVTVGAILHHAELSTSAVTQLNGAQQEYVTSATVGITPMRKKSVNILRKVIAKTQGIGSASSNSQQIWWRYAAQCAVKLAEMVFHRHKSRELLDAICARASDASPLFCHTGAQNGTDGATPLGAGFRNLFDELNSLYDDVLNSFTTSILVVNKNGTGAPVGNSGDTNSGGTIGSTGANGSGLVKNIMNNEVESVKGVERKMYKAIKAIRPQPLNESHQGFGGARRSQQSVDDALEQCAECLRIVAARLKAVFSTPPSSSSSSSTNANEDADMTTTQKAMKQSGVAITRDVLEQILARLATALGDAALATTTASVDEETDDKTDHEEELKRAQGHFRMRRWSSTSSASSGSGGSVGGGAGCSPVNARKIEVATSTLDQLEKVVYLFAESLSIYDLQTPTEMDSVRIALRTAAAS